MSPIQLLAYSYSIGSILVFFLVCLIGWKSTRIEPQIQITLYVSRASKFAILALTATLLCYFIIRYFQSKDIAMPPADKYGPFGILTHIKLQMCFLVFTGASMFVKQILIRLLDADIASTKTSRVISRAAIIVYIFMGLLGAVVIATYLIWLHYIQAQFSVFQYFKIFVYVIILNGLSVLIFDERISTAYFLT